MDSYGNHAFGILQEDGQNSFDAYPPGIQPRDMKVVIKYDAGERIFRHRDFDTPGMPHCPECDWGIRTDSMECTNLECPWGCFHNMGYSGKGGMALGWPPRRDDDHPGSEGSRASPSSGVAQSGQLPSAE